MTKLQDVHVLSFDGGGARGQMELILLDHVMKIATVMVKNPKHIITLLDKSNSVHVHSIIKSLIVEDFEGDPIHPTSAFQYIVGTSTGSIIAFSLVGGNQGKNGKRIPMSVNEVIEIGSKAAGTIFATTENGTGCLDWILKKKGNIGEIPLMPCSTRIMEQIAEEIFGKTTLTDEIESNGCIAGAVAHQFNEDPINNPDTLEIFDTMSEPQQIVTEVILGSGNAPLYFEVPSKIGNCNYIDGGILGNCPLGQAIPRIEKIWPNSNLKSVLSLTTPLDKSVKKLEEFETQWEKTFAVMAYLALKLTDGEAVYKAIRDDNPNTLFQRLRPTLKKSNLQMDEKDANKLLQGV